MKNINMLEGPMLKNIFIYTIPIILTGVIQLLFNAADLAVVGRYCGEISVAAVGNATIVSYFLVNLFAGFSVGAGVTAAQAIGAKNDEALHKTIHTAMPLSVICGVIATILGIAFSEKTAYSHEYARLCITIIRHIYKGLFCRSNFYVALQFWSGYFACCRRY